MKIGYVEWADRRAPPKEFAAFAAMKRSKGVEWLVPSTGSSAAEVAHFERWASAVNGRQRLQSLDVLEQFKRLAVSMSQFELHQMLNILSDISFRGAHVARDTLGQLYDELQSGLALIAGIHTPSWTVHFDSYQEQRLVLAPGGVCLCQWRGGALRLYPDGARVLDGSSAYRIDAIVGASLHLLSGEELVLRPAASNAVRRLGRRIQFEYGPPEAPFTAAVDTLMQACVSGYERGGIVLLWAMSPSEPRNV